MKKLRICLIVTMVCLFFSISGRENVSSGTEVNPNQSTTGSQSPAVNAGRDAIITYGSDIDSKIIDKLSEIARKCKEPGAKLEDVKPDLDSLALYKAKALPYITSFAANCVDLRIDKYDPGFLLSYKTELGKTPLFDSLFYIIKKICLSDPKALTYFRDLYLKDYPSDMNVREALIVAYYLGELPLPGKRDILDRVLEEGSVSDWDPVKKVLLRTLLWTNSGPAYVLKPAKTIQKKHKQKKKGDVWYQILVMMFEGTGLEAMAGGDIFFAHWFAHAYHPFLQKDDKDGGLSAKTLVFSDLRSALGTVNGLYSFGFDFTGLHLYRLKIDDVLLGKSNFEKSVLDEFEIYKSNIIESSFKGSTIRNGLFENTNFVNCDLEDFISIWNGTGEPIFIGSRFYASYMKHSAFVSSALINTSFERCVLEDSQFTGTLFLNVKFLQSDLSKVFFRDVLVDEETLKHMLKLPGFNKAHCRVKEIHIKKLTEEEDPLPMMQLQGHLTALRRSGKDCDIVDAILKKQKLFLIDLPRGNRETESISSPSADREAKEKR